MPHILLPLALSFVTFQQIAFLFDCYKRTKGELNENLHIDFIDYALFISFFPQLIAGPIVHHREMMPQFASLSNSNSFASCNGIIKSNNSSLRGKAEAIQNNNVDCHDSTHCVESRNDEVKSTINYEFLAKGIFVFSIGLFKKVFIADSLAKWANAGFGVVESGEMLNIAESWATSLSYTFQLYFDFIGYCDMAIGLALMFGIVLPLNFDSPYKSLNISEFWRRWHITLGRFLKECVYIPLGGNRVGKILNLRNLFIVAFLSGVWHGAGWGFVIWGVLHGIAMMIHRIYSWWLDSLANYKKSSLQRKNQSTTSSLRESQSDSWQSKTSDFNQSQSVMFQRKINESHKFTQSKKIANDSQVAKMDCHDLPKASLAMTNGNLSLRVSVSETNTTKQSINHANQHTDCQTGKLARNNKIVDCHESLRDSHNNRLFIRFTKTRLYKFLCWFITFNFINLAWIFFRAENLNGAVNLIKGMFGFANLEIPHKWSKIFSTLQGGTNEIIIWIVCAVVVCLVCRNSFEMVKRFDTQYLQFRFSLRIFSKKIYLKGGAVWTRFVLTIALFYTSILILLKNVLDSNAYTPFLYFNF